MSRKPNLLGFDPRFISWMMDYYEATMADTNIVAGIAGRQSVFSAAVRGLRNHKVVGEDNFESDGYTAVVGGEKVRFVEEHPALKGRFFHQDELEPDNYHLNMGLEQILGFMLAWNADDELLEFFANRGLAHKTVEFFRNNRKLDLTVDAIPEGIPIFPHEPYISVEGTFEMDQFPEGLIVGTWGYQTACATQASYICNILEEFGKTNVLKIEGGLRRCYPAQALAATRSILAAGFDYTSLVGIAKAYPELMKRVGGSSGHSTIIHIGSDEAAFELQLRAYYSINEGDTPAVIREKIKHTGGTGPTFLICTFDSTKGLDAGIKVMKKYGVQCQVRNDSGDLVERGQYIRTTMDGEGLTGAKIMLSDDLKPWRVYNLLENNVDVNALLMGTFLVNPYKLPGAVYKIGSDQPDAMSSQMVPMLKVCSDNPEKGTKPDPRDVYRIIGSDGYAARDVVLFRPTDSIADFVNVGEDAVKLTQRVMVHNELDYDIPDMCTLIETRAKNLALFKLEHRKFKGATKYPVVISPTIKQIEKSYRRKHATGRV